MAVSSDVTLPKTQKAVFPDRCVGCGGPKPDGTIPVKTHAIGWWTWALWAWGPRFAVEVPACERCRDRLRRQFRLRWLVGAAVAIAGVGAAVWLLGGYHGPFKRWLAMGVALLCLSPLIFWQVFNPPPVDLTAYSDSVDYEFRDPAYAREFAALNGATVEDSGADESG